MANQIYSIHWVIGSRRGDVFFVDNLESAKSYFDSLVQRTVGDDWEISLSEVIVKSCGRITPFPKPNCVFERRTSKDE